MRPDRPVKIVYVTDPNLLMPTLVSVWSLLDTISGHAEIHFWGNNLTEEHWRSVARVAAFNPDVELVTKDLDKHLGMARGPKDYISAATMGRLFIPRYIDGYVLYIDGDTLIVNDVSPLFSLDLGSSYAGVVRDYTALHTMSDQKIGAKSGGARFHEITALLHPAPPTDYFNAGIMLFNSDQIRSEAKLMQNVEDVQRASKQVHGDQDHLNDLFKNKVKFLDIAWNLSWGRDQRHRSIFRTLNLPETGLLPGKPHIIHYHGPQKPWTNARYDLWSNRGRMTFQYRRKFREFANHFPDLIQS